jgi:transposase
MRDLPIGPQAVNLIVRTPQLSCDRCGSYFTPSYPAIAPGAHATERFLEQAARRIRFSDIAHVAAFFAVPPNRLARWYYDSVERPQQTPPATLKPITSIGIDELSLKKNIAGL